MHLFFVCIYISLASLLFFVLMIRRPPISTRTVTLFPYTTLFRSGQSRRFFCVRSSLLARCMSKSATFPYCRIGNFLPTFPLRTQNEQSSTHRDRKSTRLNPSH